MPSVVYNPLNFILTAFFSNIFCRKVLNNLCQSLLQMKVGRDEIEEGEINADGTDKGADAKFTSSDDSFRHNRGC